MSGAEKYSFTNHLPENIPVSDTELVLRLFEPDDAETLLEIATEENTAKYVPWSKAIKDVETSQQMIGRFHNQWQQGLFARYLVTRHDEACGYFGIWPADVPDMYEIGFAVLPRHRGKGIAKQVLDTAEEVAMTNLEAAGLVAHIDEPNEASQHTIAKQGFHPTDKFNEEGERRYEKQLR